MKLAFWKPRKNNDGHAAIFELNDRGLWLTMMPQDGEKSFDSSRKANSKLGLSDVAEMLAVITNRKEGAGYQKDGKWSGMYHQSRKEGDSSIIGFQNGQYGYQLSLSVKRGGNTQRCSVGLTDGELELMRVYLERAALVLMDESAQEPQAQTSMAATSQSDDYDHPF